MLTGSRGSYTHTHTPKLGEVNTEISLTHNPLHAYHHLKMVMTKTGNSLSSFSFHSQPMCSTRGSTTTKETVETLPLSRP